MQNVQGLFLMWPGSLCLFLFWKWGHKHYVHVAQKQWCRYELKRVIVTNRKCICAQWAGEPANTYSKFTQWNSWDMMWMRPAPLQIYFQLKLFVISLQLCETEWFHDFMQSFEKLSTLHDLVAYRTNFSVISWSNRFLYDFFNLTFFWRNFSPLFFTTLL